MLTQPENPLLPGLAPAPADPGPGKDSSAPKSSPDLEQKTFRIETLEPAALVHREPEDLGQLDQRLLFRKQSAREFVGKLRPKMHLYGFSKGQFSLIDILEAILEQTGPAELAISTWTAANADLARLEAMLASGAFSRVRFLVDFSFQRRQPGVLQTLRNRYGLDAIRCAKNHAKFLLIKAADFRLVVRTSMNLNFNPRFEDIDLKDDPAIYAFLDGILERIFDQIPAARQLGQSVRDHNLDFARIKE